MTDARRDSFDAYLTAAACTAAQDLAALRAKLGDRLEQGAAARTWAAIPLRIRTVVVMAAIDDADPQLARQLAGMPWGSYTGAEQARLGSVARELRAALADAGLLK